MNTLQKREIWLHVIIWVLVFCLVPLSLSFHVMAGHDETLQVKEIFSLWDSVAPYLILFLLHNFLAIPFLQKKKWGIYAVITLGIIAAFVVYTLHFSAAPLEMRPPRPMNEPPLPFSGEPRPAPPGNLRPVDPRFMRITIGIMTIMINLGIKALFRSLRQENEMKQMEAQRLSQQLETLRYQINPHFFMNTLNNIHALVDIDPEKAKESIEEFSKLMRIVLYDGNAPTIPLQLEIDYLQHYVSLMRLRYPQDVDIHLQVPDKSAGIMIPPLLMATFVENAFKHGISYEETSFVHIHLSVENQQVVFKCSNSTHPHKKKQSSGIGLQNIQNRLALLYGKNYSLHIEDGAKIYTIILRLPLQ